MGEACAECGMPGRVEVPIAGGLQVFFDAAGIASRECPGRVHIEAAVGDRAWLRRLKCQGEQDLEYCYKATADDEADTIRRTFLGFPISFVDDRSIAGKLVLIHR